MRWQRLCFILVLLALLPVSASAQAGAFGNAVVIADGEMIVAEPNTNFRPGTVYIYRKSGGEWREAAQLRAPDAERADGFGSALAVSGGTLVVAQRDGRLHAFRKQGSTWAAAGTVPLPEGTRGIGAIAAEGEWLLVGSPGAGGGGPRGGGGGAAAAQPGTVHVFQRAANGTWTPRGQLTPAEGAPGDRFGATIAISNGRALIGAPASSQTLTPPRAGGRPGAAPAAAPAEPVTIAGAGRVYEYRLENGAWQAAGALDSRPILNQSFGAALALANDVAVIGAPGDADGHGAAFVFRRNAETGAWTEATRLVAFSGVRADAFGTSVAIDGQDVWVGSPVNRGIEPGLAYVFRGRAGERLLDAPQRFDVGEQTPTDNFGERVAAANGVAAVVAAGMHRNAGAVYVYERNTAGEWQRNAMLVSPPDALPAIVGEERRCSNEGKVGLFDCKDVELLAFIPNSMLAAPDRARGIRLNDNWGWTDPQTDREYAIIGRTDGTSFVDITDPTNPVLVGDMPQPAGSPPSPTWRDIKVYRNHAYVVADAAGPHGVQVFDLTRLRNVADKPALFEPDARYTGINSAHNIVINEETGFAYSVGSSAGGETCAGGLHMIDIREPKNPKFAGCFAHDGTGRAARGYTHDAQCVVYRGPDNRYTGREICLGLNENAVSIADVTDKQNPKALSSARYPNPAYTHQGWLSEDHRFFYVDDESDVIAGTAPTTRTTVWDLTDLEDPVLVKEFMGSMPASAHNQYVRGNLLFQANYRYGLHVLDISDPANPREVGFFDTAPYLEGPGFSGAWSNYPFFKSGTVIVTSVQEGLFILKKRPLVF